MGIALYENHPSLLSYFIILCFSYVDPFPSYLQCVNTWVFAHWLRRRRRFHLWSPVCYRQYLVFMQEGTSGYRHEWGVKPSWMEAARPRSSLHTEGRVAGELFLFLERWYWIICWKRTIFGSVACDCHVAHVMSRFRPVHKGFTGLSLCPCHTSFIILQLKQHQSHLRFKNRSCQQGL